MVRFVAELAFYLNRLPVAYDVVQILSAQCRNRTGDALLGAVALECGIHRIVDLKPKLAENQLQDLFRCLPIFQHLRDGGNLRDLLLETIHHVVRCKRHQLDDKSSRLSDRPVRIHENTESDRRRHLLGGGKIVRQILRNLTGLQRDLSHVRLL